MLTVVSAQDWVGSSFPAMYPFEALHDVSDRHVAVRIYGRGEAISHMCLTEGLALARLVKPKMRHR